MASGIWLWRYSNTIQLHLQQTKYQQLLRQLAARTPDCMLYKEHCAQELRSWTLNLRCTDTNNRYELLLGFILTTNLNIFNVGIKPTFTNKINQKVLDVTFSTIIYGVESTGQSLVLWPPRYRISSYWTGTQNGHQMREGQNGIYIRNVSRKVSTINLL